LFIGMIRFSNLLEGMDHQRVVRGIH